MRGLPTMKSLRARWDQSGFRGGLVGIASVALATVAVGLVCAVVAVVVTAVF